MQIVIALTNVLNNEKYNNYTQKIYNTNILTNILSNKHIYLI